VAERGKITDRNGVVLAENRTAYTVYARSNAITDSKTASLLLADALGISQTLLYEKLTKKKASEITVAKKVEKESIQKLFSPGNITYLPLCSCSMFQLSADRRYIFSAT
jgi:stage V sporulation protein D (sporulation-specific penicillin-binding protein)